MHPLYDLTAIMRGDAAQLEALYSRATTPASPERLRKNTNETFFNRLFVGEHIDAALTPFIVRLKHVFTEHTQIDASFYCDEQHPLRQLFNFILTHAITWYPREAKTNQQFLEKLTDIVTVFEQNLLAINSSNHECHSALSSLLEWHEAEEKRAQLLEHRLCEAELNRLKTAEREYQVDAALTTSVLQQVNLIQQGDWILFFGEDNQIIRCKLAFKNSEFDKLLFVDKIGRKVMTKSHQDFALCITTGIAKPLRFLHLQELIEKHLEGLIDLTEKNHALLQHQEEKTAILANIAQLNEHLKLIKEVEQEALQHEKLIAKQKKAAAEKALKEANRLAEEKRLQELSAQQEAQKINALTSDLLIKRQFAQQQIQAMNVGAWVEIINGNLNQRCKLAVVISAAGKYIFVDNLGRKVAEYQQEQLVDDYLNQKISLLNNGDKFEDQLAKVIRSLRKDIS